MVKMVPRLRIALLLLMLAAILIKVDCEQSEYIEETVPIKYDSLKCYDCTSYLDYCGTTVNSSKGVIPHVGCRSRCFIRQGEESEDMLYRGCLDDFKDVAKLEKDYLGCKEQYWNGKSRVWCFCDSDVCNGQSMETISQMGEENQYSFKPKHLDIDYSENMVEQIERPPALKQADPVYEEIDPEYSINKDYAKEANIASQPRLLELSPYGSLDEPSRYQEVSVHNSYHEIPNEDYDFGHINQRVSTDVEQVHYGQSNDIFVSPFETGETSQQAQYQYVDHTQDNRRGYSNGFVEQPYYPYVKEDQARYYTESQNSVDSDTKYQVNYDPYVQSPNYDDRGGYAYEEFDQYTDSDNENQGNTDAYSDQLVGEEDGRELNVRQKLGPSQDYCTRSGLFPNPHDCSEFIACIMDPHLGEPVMYPMRCPAKLFWDNQVRACVQKSSTCPGPNDVNPFESDEGYVAIQQGSKYHDYTYGQQ